MKKLFLCLSLLSAPAFAADDRSAMPDDHDDFRAPYGGYVCVAVNGFGFRSQRFQGYGFNRFMASQRALTRCRQGSIRPVTCRIRFCQPSRGFIGDGRGIDDPN